jgi:hypothetical protein
MVLAGHRRPEVANTTSERPTNLRKPLGPEHEQSDHEDEEQMSWLEYVADHETELRGSEGRRTDESQILTVVDRLALPSEFAASFRAFGNAAAAGQHLRDRGQAPFGWSTTSTGARLRSASSRHRRAWETTSSHRRCGGLGVATDDYDYYHGYGLGWPPTTTLTRRLAAGAYG